MFTPLSNKGWQIFLEGLAARDDAAINEGTALMAQEARRLAVSHRSKKG